MHRVHHSSSRDETDSNYGFNFPFWDRIFRTYLAEPSRGHEKVEIGLSQYRGVGRRFFWVLILPFGNYSRREL